MARLLIAEDDEAVRAFVSRALMIDGHDVVTAEDGANALDILAEDNKFDLLLSDIKMPVMDGIALALNVARDHDHLPILLMTCLLYTSPSPRDRQKSRMPSSA